MQPQYDEIWAVVVGKEVFHLNRPNMEKLKAATKEGMRTMIWFEDFGISIPHIQAVYLVSRKNRNQLSAPVVVEEVISPEDQAARRKKIADIKRKLVEKMSTTQI